MRTLVARSIPEAFKKASTLVSSFDGCVPPYCWFRGSRDSSHELVPGAYRRPGYSEHSVYTDFTNGAVAFADVGRPDDWETYCLAQHHGLPTRMLDWTESFTAALFFAFDGWDGNTEPCVWILEPELLNETFFGWFGLFSTNVRELKHWLPKDKFVSRSVSKQGKDGLIYCNDWPVALMPRKANRRVHAQQGAFTIHGLFSESLDDLIVKRGGNVADQLAKLRLVGFDKAEVFNDLSMLGIHRSAIYPDLDNYVKQLQAYYEW